MNPEFRRQLWLQFSPTRLVLMPALLLLGAVAILLSSDRGDAASALALSSGVAFMVLVFGMGSRAASASVMDEVTERTWDQQRMSALQPWAMTWGKLAGATAYGWYGGAICLAIAVPCALSVGRLDGLAVMLTAAAAVLTGVFLQALILAINLQLVKNGGRVVKRGGAWFLIFLATAISTPLYSLLKHSGVVVWWNQPIDNVAFAMGSMGLLALCALVSAWRSMAEVLAVRQWPWGWPALALVATGYCTGFHATQQAQTFCLVGMGFSALLTYFALFTEPQPRPLWQRVVSRAAAGQWRAALEQLPSWPTTLLLTCALALGSTASLGDLAATTVDPVWNAYSQQPVALALLVVRDCLLALCFTFAPRARRQVMGALVTLVVLYGLLPWLVGTTGNTLLFGLVLPPAAGQRAVLVAVLHVAVAAGLLRWRWNRTRPA